MVRDVVDADVHAVPHLRRLLLGSVPTSGTDADLRHLGLARRPGRDDVALAVQLDAVGRDLEVLLAGESMRHGFLGAVEGLDLATLTPDLFQVVEVPFGHGGNVVTAEDTDLEVTRLFQAILVSNLGTGALQVRQGLVDDAVGSDVLGDGVGVTVVGDEFVRRGQIDSVDVGMPGLR